MIEFVLWIKKEEKPSCVSCGFSQILLQDLVCKEKITLEIEGGSPEKKQTILSSDVRAKRSGLGKVSSIFEGKIVSQIHIEIKPLKQLNDEDKVLIFNI